MCCYFHFTNSIHRQIQHLHLSIIYRDDDDTPSSARKLMALPLIPFDQIECALQKKIENKALDSMEPLIDYFSRYWMTKVKWSL
jgi:hypothetical protein